MCAREINKCIKNSSVIIKLISPISIIVISSWEIAGTVRELPPQCHTPRKWMECKRIQGL
jgi:hypothetical protein